MKTLFALALVCGSLLASVASAQTCVPSCRDGYMCHQGQCISACNPSCGPEERCTGAGVCAPASVSNVQSMPVPPPPPPSSDRYAPVEEERPALEPSGVSAVRELPGWALGGAILGFVAAPLILGLSIGSAATTGELVPSLPLGALATVVFGITVPLIAGAGGSARNGTGVNGAVGLRVVGWILYGITLGLAVVAVVLGVTTEIPAPIILGLGGAAFLSCVFMSIDALVSRSQAKDAVERNRARADSVRVAPFVTIAPQPRGPVAPMIGLAGVF